MATAESLASFLAVELEVILATRAWCDAPPPISTPTAPHECSHQLGDCGRLLPSAATPVRCSVAVRAHAADAVDRLVCRRRASKSPAGYRDQHVSCMPCPCLRSPRPLASAPLPAAPAGTLLAAPAEPTLTSDDLASEDLDLASDELSGGGAGLERSARLVLVDGGARRRRVGRLLLRRDESRRV